MMQAREHAQELQHNHEGHKQKLTHQEELANAKRKQAAMGGVAKSSSK